jgi:hypothetical protein
MNIAKTASSSATRRNTLLNEVPTKPKKIRKKIPVKKIRELLVKMRNRKPLDFDIKDETIEHALKRMTNGHEFQNPYVKGSTIGTTASIVSPCISENNTSDIDAPYRLLNAISRSACGELGGVGDMFDEHDTTMSTAWKLASG